MIKLFKYEGFKVVISEEALLLKPFKVLWDRDKSNDKELALQELAYIYFMEDPRSDYAYYIDKEERSIKVREGEGFNKKWKPDSKVEEAMIFYSSFKTPSSLLLEDTLVAIDKLRKYIRNIDLEETDDNGKPKYTLNTFTQTIKLIPSLISELNKIETAILKETQEVGKLRGQGEKTLFEDGVSL